MDAKTTASGSGKRRRVQTPEQELADYYLKAAGVAAIWIDQDGYVGAHGAATIDSEPGGIVYCCERGRHFELAYQVQEWKRAQETMPAPETTARYLEHVSEVMGIGLTKHPVAVDRAHAAVAAVNQAFQKLSASGDLRDLNTAFKQARAVDRTVRWSDFVAARKAALLEQLARRSSG